VSLAEPTLAQPLLQKAASIADIIARSDAAIAYWQAKDKMARHTEAQSLFDDLKKKTNGMLVLKDRLGEGHEKYNRVKQEAAAIEAHLAEIPVALQYKTLQDELNAMLQEVTLVLLARLQRAIPVERGPQGCGSGGSCSTGGCGTSCSSH